MHGFELHQYFLREYSQENARCEWKESKNLKNSFCGGEKDDVMSYVSAIANMEGGHLVIGVKDKTFEIVGTDISRLILNTLFSCGSDRILAALGKDRIASFHYISGNKWVKKTIALERSLVSGLEVLKLGIR